MFDDKAMTRFRDLMEGKVPEGASRKPGKASQKGSEPRVVSAEEVARLIPGIKTV